MGPSRRIHCFLGEYTCSVNLQKSGVDPVAAECTSSTTIMYNVGASIPRYAAVRRRNHLQIEALDKFPYFVNYWSLKEQFSP